MGITQFEQVFSTDRLDCRGSFTVTLSLTAQPEIVTAPKDLVLLLDRSGSLGGCPLAAMKAGAKDFLRRIARACGGLASGTLGSGTRAALVSFADCAAQDVPLTDSLQALCQGVDALRAGGRTNHADGLEQALALLSPASSRERIIVLFTDGVTTTGGDASPIAAAARAAGIQLYCLGLAGTGGLDRAALRDWASRPAASYFSTAELPEELDALFLRAAEAIAGPGATEITVTQKLNPCFRIVSTDQPSLGAAILRGDQGFQWTIPLLGALDREKAVFSYTLEHLGPCEGPVSVNQLLTYEDQEGQSGSFPEPPLFVDCPQPVDPCPDALHFTLEPCQDSCSLEIRDLTPAPTGTILQLSLTLRAVCPNRRVALAVRLWELDEKNHRLPRGMRTVAIPAHSGPGCRDISIPCLEFILPIQNFEFSPSFCAQRRFQAEVLSNYMDFHSLLCDKIC